MRQKSGSFQESSLPSGLYSYRVELEAYPVPSAGRERYAAAMEALTRKLLQAPGMHWVMALQCDELHRDAAIQKVSRHAALWRPNVGMGVYPDQPPPASWTGETLLDRDYSEQTPPLKHTVIQINGTDEGRFHALAAMAGTGGVVQAFSSRSTPELLSSWHGELLSRIEDEGFRAYPIYVPLLNAASLERISVDERHFEDLFHDCEAYVRESFEDQALLVITRSPAPDALNAFAAALL